MVNIEIEVENQSGRFKKEAAWHYQLSYNQIIPRSNKFFQNVNFDEDLNVENNDTRYYLDELSWVHIHGPYNYLHMTT